MDPSSFEDQRARRRRSAYGAMMLAALATAHRPLSVDDLAAVVGPHGARLSDVADWLATARQSGILRDQGFEDLGEDLPHGPRRFSLAETALAVMQVDRRSRDRRSGATLA